MMKYKNDRMAVCRRVVFRVLGRDISPSTLPGFRLHHMEETFRDTYFIKSTAKVQQNHAITLNMGHGEKTQTWLLFTGHLRNSCEFYTSLWDC